MDTKKLVELASMVDGRNMYSVYQSVHIGGGRVVVTNGERQVEVAATEYDFPAVLVNGKVMRDALGSLPSGEVDLEVSASGKLVLTSGTSVVQLNALPAADHFVEITRGQALVTVQCLETYTIHDVVRLTVFASDKSHYSPAGRDLTLDVIQSSDKTKLRVVAADGYRLACAYIPVACNGDVEKFRDILLPVRLLPMRLLRECTMITLYDNRRLLLSCGDAEVTIICDDAAPFAFSSLLGREYDARMHLDTDEVKMALRQAIAVGALRVDYDYAQGIITALGDDGEVRATLWQSSDTAVPRSVDDTVVRLNPSYWLDVLEVMSAGEFELALDYGKTVPVTLTQKGIDGEYIIMPMAKV